MLRFWFSKQLTRFDLWVVYPVCIVLGVRVSWWWAVAAFFPLCVVAVLGERALERQRGREILRRARLSFERRS